MHADMLSTASLQGNLFCWLIHLSNIFNHESQSNNNIYKILADELTKIYKIHSHPVHTPWLPVLHHSGRWCHRQVYCDLPDGGSPLVLPGPRNATSGQNWKYTQNTLGSQYNITDHCTEFKLWNIKMYFHFLGNLHSQYHGCWWPGNKRSQYINSNVIDLVSPRYPVSLLTHLPVDKMAVIYQKTSKFSWMKMLEFRLKIHWNLFLRVQLTISQHWIR